MKLRTLLGPVVRSILLLVLIALAITISFGSAKAATPKTYYQILKSATKAMASVKTWSADIVVKGDMGGSVASMNGRITGSGDRIYTYFRIEEFMAAISITLGDDGILWTEYIDTGGDIVRLVRVDTNILRESYRKYSSIPGAPEFAQESEQDPSKILEKLGPMYNLAVAGTETVHGVDTFVLKGTIKRKYRKQIERSVPLSASGMSPHKIRIAVGAKDGFVRKLERWNADDYLFMTLTFSEVKINPVLEDDYFEYTPPEDVEVNDDTDLYILPD